MTPAERADPNPEALAGVGTGPLLTAAEPAAVASFVEGAAGAAHRCGAAAGRSEAWRASAVSSPSPTRYRPSETPAAPEFLGFCLLVTRASAQRSGAAGAHLRRKGSHPECKGPPGNGE